MTLSGKKILLTGHSSGLGFYLAENLLKEGVILTAISRSVFLTDDRNGHYNQIGLDLSHPDIDFKLTLDDNDFDVVINNAGITNRNYVEDHSNQSINDMINIMLTNPIKIIKDTLIDHKDQVYLTVLSGSANEDFRKLSVYSAVKAGLNKFTKCLIKDYDDKGYGTTTKKFLNVYPGPIDTKLCPESYKDGRVKLLDPNEYSLELIELIKKAFD